MLLVMYMNKLKELCKRYQQAIYTLLAVLIIVGIVYFALHGFNTFVKWATTDVGSVADWAGSIGTILAFIAVIWQQGRQENITRAVHIEESRPRFSIIFTPKPKLKSKVLFWGEKRNVTQINTIIENRTGQNYRFISIENISNNVVYDYSVILKYHSKDNSLVREDYWNSSGLFPRRSIVIVPKFLGTDKDEIGNYIYDELLVKFTTPANEVGFFTMKNTNNDQTDSSLGQSQYYFVRGSHVKRVTAINTDKMIEVNEPICKNLDKEFNEITGGTSLGEVDENGKVH